MGLLCPDHAGGLPPAPHHGGAGGGGETGADLAEGSVTVCVMSGSCRPGPPEPLSPPPSPRVGLDVD